MSEPIVMGLVLIQVLNALADDALPVDRDQARIKLRELMESMGFSDEPQGDDVPDAVKSALIAGAERQRASL